MTDRIKEQLSTFLDGELPDAETALLLKRLERDDDLRGALSRYSLIGAVLRNDGDVPAARQVAARVSAAIAREPAQDGNGIPLPGRAALLRSGAGLAIAAGVAAVALLLVQQAPLQDGAAPEAQVAQVAESPIVPGLRWTRTRLTWRILRDTSRDRRPGQYPAGQVRELPGRALWLCLAAGPAQRQRGPDQRERRSRRD